MSKPIRVRFMLFALLALLTASVHVVHRAYAEGGGREVAPQNIWSLGKVHDSVGANTGDGRHVGTISLRAELDRLAVLKNGRGEVNVEVTISSPDRPLGAGRSATDMVVIVDRSGSMAGDKLHYARSALLELIDRLDSDDRFGLVAYDSTAGVLIPMSYATPAERANWRRIVSRIDTGGSTNMSEGLDLALGMLEANRRGNRPARALLLSDGLANTGDSSVEGLVARARRAFAGEYVLSTMGIGSDFDENLMTKLASAGTGAFYYLAKLAVLPQFFDAELLTANQTVARGAALEIHLEPGISITSVMGLPVERRGDLVTIPLGSLYAAHARRIWITLAVPTRESARIPVGRIGARFRTEDGERSLHAEALPELRCVESYGEFRGSVRRDVWERAMLDEALGRSQEEMGDAIAQGTPADVDQALQEAVRHRRLATELGSASVLRQIDELEKSAALAKQAQKAPAAARSSEAKRQKATGYITRNRGSYPNADATVGF